MSEDLAMIREMLTYRRPSGSLSERAFIERFIKPLGVTEDAHRNYYKIVGDEPPTIMWSSHTDSVHQANGRQSVHLDQTGFLRLPKKSKSDCLGADCAAGMWIMIEMIKANVPGLYIFHHAEEIGCKGSIGIADKSPEFIKDIKAAVAFDRRNINEVITHQRSRTASDAFARSIAQQLPERFEPSDKGFLTDTKMYMHLIPECSNISVGYFDEHTPQERLYVPHLIQLRDHMIKIDQSKFVIEREPAYAPIKPKKPKLFPQATSFGHNNPKVNYLEPKTLYDLLWLYPEESAEALQEMGITFDNISEAVLQRSFKFSA
jgi:hypothetical protein